jgi:hypothetical protein
MPRPTTFPVFAQVTSSNSFEILGEKEKHPRIASGALRGWAELNKEGERNRTTLFTKTPVFFSWPPKIPPPR